MADAEWQRSVDEGHVDIAQVIADDQERPVSFAQVIAADYARPSQQKNCRAQQRVVNQQPDPGDRPTKHPRRVVILDAGRRFALKHVLEVADGFHGGKAGFAQIDLVALFERTEKFDAVERAEVEIGFEVSGWAGRKLG